MVMKNNGNVRGEVRVSFLALFASKPHIFMCGALKLSRVVRANFLLNIAIAMLFFVPTGENYPLVSAPLADVTEFLTKDFCLDRVLDARETNARRTSSNREI